MNTKEHNPKVFISYSQDSISFADKVLAFSNRLRSEGIDTILDQYEESPAEGWPRWMDRNIDDAEYVLVIGSVGYAQKAYGQTPSGKGLGVKWESNIIYQKIYSADTLNSKFIPVVFNESDIKYIPTPLQGVTHYNIGNNAGYDKLYWRLRGISKSEKPALGKLRPLPEKERRTLFVTSFIDLEAWDKAIWRGAGFIAGYTEIPVLLLMFINESPASKIFKDWIAELGSDDKRDDIRVALVEGDVPDEPAGYYVVVGTNLEEAIKRAEKNGISTDEMLIMNFSRIIRANPTDNFACFNMFREAYQKAGEYYLVPAIIDEKTMEFKPLFEYGIHKRKLIYRNIKDIREDNDEDAILLKRNKPFVPYESQ